MPLKQWTENYNPRLGSVKQRREGIENCIPGSGFQDGQQTASLIPGSSPSQTRTCWDLEHTFRINWTLTTFLLLISLIYTNTIGPDGDWLASTMCVPSQATERAMQTLRHMETLIIDIDHGICGGIAPNVRECSICW